jgi:hypothetical protein
MVDGVGLTVIFDTTWPTPADLACDDSRCGTDTTLRPWAPITRNVGFPCSVVSN